MEYDKSFWRSFLPEFPDETVNPFEKSGILLIDKPAGLSSMDVLRVIKKIGKIKKAGHAGTLDPMATGVLPVLINKATSLSNQLMEGSKEYEGTLLFGQSYDTQDITGNPIGEKISDFKLTLAELQHFASKFVGEISQIPPVFSAIKKNGRPLYDYARSEQTVHIDPRKVVVHRFEITDFTEPDKASFYVYCDKGVYVRTLVHDLGKDIGIGAAMSSLRRLSVGKFHIDQCVELRKIKSPDDILDKLIDISRD